MNCRDFSQIAAAHADGQLTPAERLDVEEHLAACPSCREESQRQTAIRQLVRDRIAVVPVPGDLHARVVGALPASLPPRRQLSRRTVLAGAIAAALVIGIWPLFRTANDGLFAVLQSDVRAADTEEISLAMRTDDAAALRSYYLGNGVDFDNAVEDLGSAGLRLVGGTPSSIGGRTTTLTLYEKASDHVVCRRFRLGDVTIPDGGQQIGRSRLFTRAGVHIAITRIGDVVCAMASNMPREQFVSALHNH
jgi:anti-sigma factor RsiW